MFSLGMCPFRQPHLHFGEGRSEAATENWTYYLDMRENMHTDFRGNPWTTTWGFCCGRVQAKVEPAADVDGSGTNKQATHTTRFTFSGDLAHEAIAKNFSAITFPTAPGQYLDVPDADTINEVTTRYDARHRPVARTVWLVPRGAVNPDAVPIAGGGQAGDPAVTIGGVVQGLTTTWRYDEDLTDGVAIDHDYATQITAALGGGFFGAGSVGSAVEVTNPNGEKMVIVYDGAGRNVLTIDGLLHTKSVAYDAMVAGISGSQGNLLSTTFTDTLSHININYTDAAGRTLATRDGLSKDTLFGFDADGNTLSVRDPNGVGEDCVFDARNRMASCTDTHGDQTQWAYDANSNKNSFTDAKGKSDSRSFDGRDRKASWTSRLASDTTAWGYDANNNVTTLTDAQGGVTDYTFDLRNLRILEAYPDDDTHLHTGINDHVSFAWDAAGRARNKLDQASNTIAYVFDMANRLTSRTYPDTNNDTFTYDLASRMLTAASARYNNTVTRTYDAAGRLTADNLTVASTTYAVGIGYDNADRNISITYPDSSVVNRTYTNRDQLYQVQYTPSGGSASTVATRAYDDGMRLLTTTYGNSLVETRAYRNDTGGRVDNLVASIAIPSITGFTYTYDANKNKTAESDGILTNYAWATGTTGYDDKDRLTNWSRTSGDSQTWNLSLVGDWTNTVVNGTTDTRTHNAVHELLSRSTSATSLAYDAKGNLTTNSNGQTYTWDYDNKMASATVSGTTTTYAYDALGRRVSKGTMSALTVFASIGQQEIAEYQGGTLLHKYIFGSYIDEPLMLVNVSGASETSHYYHANSLNCVAALTDSTGGLTERYVYNAYGNAAILNPTGTTVLTVSTVGNPILYTGRRLEPETSLYYYRARYYDADAGRFIGRDPIAQDSFGALEYNLSSRHNALMTMSGGIQRRFNVDLYEYARWNPFTYLDPSGLQYGYGGTGTPPGQSTPTPTGSNGQDASLPGNPDMFGNDYNPTTYGEWRNAFWATPYELYQANKIHDKISNDPRLGKFSGPWLGPWDAMRHCMASCELSKKIGCKAAEGFGTAHENDEVGTSPFGAIDTQMDLHNNARGRQIGAAGLDCYKGCLAALNNGTLRTVKPSGLDINGNPVPPGVLQNSNQPWP